MNGFFDQLKVRQKPYFFSTYICYESIPFNSFIHITPCPLLFRLGANDYRMSTFCCMGWGVFIGRRIAAQYNSTWLAAAQMYPSWIGLFAFFAGVLSRFDDLFPTVEMFACFDFHCFLFWSIIQSRYILHATPRQSRNNPQTQKEYFFRRRIVKCPSDKFLNFKRIWVKKLTCSNKFQSIPKFYLTYF